MVRLILIALLSEISFLLVVYHLFWVWPIFLVGFYLLCIAFFFALLFSLLNTICHDSFYDKTEALRPPAGFRMPQKVLMRTLFVGDLISVHSPIFWGASRSWSACDFVLASLSLKHWVESAKRSFKPIAVWKLFVSDIHVSVTMNERIDALQPFYFTLESRFNCPTLFFDF